MNTKSSNLIHTSVDDARSSLKCAEDNSRLNIAHLDAAILALQALAESGHPQPAKLKLLLAARKRWINRNLALKREACRFKALQAEHKPSAPSVLLGSHSV